MHALSKICKIIYLLASKTQYMYMYIIQNIQRFYCPIYLLRAVILTAQLTDAETSIVYFVISNLFSVIHVDVFYIMTRHGSEEKISF